MSKQPVTQPTQASVQAFIAQLSDPQKRQDAQVLVALMQKITGEPPVMWGPSIIGFGKSHYKYASGREGDMGLVGFSPRKAALTIYFVDGVSRHADLMAKLGPHTLGKVCLYIKRLADVDMQVLEELVQRSYAYAVAHKNNVPRAQ